MKLIPTVLVGIAVVGALAILWIVWWRRRSELQFQEAVEAFPGQPNLGGIFLEAANLTGKPRGLRWRHCELHGEPLFATDHTTGEIYALSGATIGFEAIPGGDMEDVEAVGDIRYVTAVFVYRDGQWRSDGRAIFNLEPTQAIERLGEMTKAIEP